MLPQPNSWLPVPWEGKDETENQLLVCLLAIQSITTGAMQVTMKI